jgi:hypothetical protein
MDRSPELDQVRRLLFSKLAPEEGWQRIEAAFRGAHDPERVASIERRVAADPTGDLLADLRRLR